MTSGNISCKPALVSTKNILRTTGITPCPSLLFPRMASNMIAISSAFLNIDGQRSENGLGAPKTLPGSKGHSSHLAKALVIFRIVMEKKYASCIILQKSKDIIYIMVKRRANLVQKRLMLALNGPNMPIQSGCVVPLVCARSARAFTFPLSRTFKSHKTCGFYSRRRVAVPFGRSASDP